MVGAVNTSLGQMLPKSKHWAVTAKRSNQSSRKEVTLSGSRHIGLERNCKARVVIELQTDWEERSCHNSLEEAMKIIIP